MQMFINLTRNSLSLLLCLLVSKAVAQLPEPVILPTPWKVGDKASYVIIKSRGYTDRPTSTSKTPLEIKVLEASDDNFLISWKLGKVELPKGAVTENSIAAQLLSISSELEIQLELENPQTISGVRNWKELKASIEQKLELIYESLDEEVAQAISIQFRPLFATKESVTAFATRDAQMFFLVLGGSYTEQPSKYNGSLANPFGGPPLPSKASFRLKSIDKTCAVITWSQQLEPKATQKSFEKMTESMARRLGENPEVLKDQFYNFQITDNAEFEIDLSSGWPIRAKHERLNRTGKVTITDTSTFQCISPGR